MQPELVFFLHPRVIINIFYYCSRVEVCLRLASPGAEAEAEAERAFGSPVDRE